MNVKALEYVWARDFPKNEAPTCLYCGDKLKMELIGDGSCGNDKPVLDHLDDDPKNNSRDNLALACQRCNQRKRADSRLKDMADEKIVENIKYVPPPSMADRPGGGYARASYTIRQAVHGALVREVVGAKRVPYEGFCRNVTYQLRKRYRLGSLATVRAHVRGMCTRSAPWQITRDDKGRKVISRRPGR